MFSPRFKPSEKVFLGATRVTVVRQISKKEVEIRNQFGFVETVPAKELRKP